MEVKSDDLSIIYLNWKNWIHSQAVWNLALDLLPKNVLPVLGNNFIFHFHFSKLVKVKLVQVCLN